MASLGNGGNTRIRTRQANAPQGMPLSKEFGTAPINLAASYVTDALMTARSDYDLFLKTERDWLSENLSPLSVVIPSLFEHAIRNYGENTGHAVNQGAYLGGSVLRAVITDGEYPREACLANLRTRDLGLRGMVYDGDFTPEQFVDIYGQETADAFGQIQTPAARSVCGAVVIVALLPKT